jgi:enoyl-CoA hydratase/carnithine racemase
MSTTPSDHIIATTEGRVRTIVINRPEKKNALTLSMYEGLTGELQRAAEDPAIRVAVLTGVGEVFTSGNDLADFQEAGGLGEDAPVFRFIQALPRFPKPLIAAVNGLAVGIGTTLLPHCDLVYAGSNAIFLTPFSRLGVTPEAGSSLLLPLIVGFQRATELLMLGETFDAERAREAGLVNEVVSPEELSRRVADRAGALAALPPSAVRQTKELLRGELLSKLEEVMELEGQIFRERLTSPEAKEAFAAFFEKRPADFSQFE